MSHSPIRDRQDLTEVLLGQKMLTETQLRNAEQVAKETKKTFEEILREEGIVTDALLDQAIAEHYMIPSEKQLPLFESKKVTAALEEFLLSTVGSKQAKKYASAMGGVLQKITEKRKSMLQQRKILREQNHRKRIEQARKRKEEEDQKKEEERAKKEKDQKKKEEERLKQEALRKAKQDTKKKAKELKQHMKQEKKIQKEALQKAKRERAKQITEQIQAKKIVDREARKAHRAAQLKKWQATIQGFLSRPEPKETSEEREKKLVEEAKAEARKQVLIEQEKAKLQKEQEQIRKGVAESAAETKALENERKKLEEERHKFEEEKTKERPGLSEERKEVLEEEKETIRQEAAKHAQVEFDKELQKQQIKFEVEKEQLMKAAQF